MIMSRTDSPVTVLVTSHLSRPSVCSHNRCRAQVETELITSALKHPATQTSLSPLSSLHMRENINILYFSHVRSYILLTANFLLNVSSCKRLGHEKSQCMLENNSF